MTPDLAETLLSQVSRFGLPFVVLCAYLSCLILPIPTSLVMVTAGGVMAAGLLDPALVYPATWLAAIAGDQTGYLIGRRAGPPLLDRLSRRPRPAAMIARAREGLAQHGVTTVFLSAWAFAPLCPYVNLAAGSLRYDWRRFALANAAGEAVWVGLYLTLGLVFGDQLAALFRLLPGLSGAAILGLVLAAGLALGWRLLRRRPA